MGIGIFCKNTAIPVVSNIQQLNVGQEYQLSGYSCVPSPTSLPTSSVPSGSPSITPTSSSPTVDFDGCETNSYYASSDMLTDMSAMDTITVTSLLNSALMTRSVVVNTFQGRGLFGQCDTLGRVLSCECHVSGVWQDAGHHSVAGGAAKQRRRANPAQSSRCVQHCGGFTRLGESSNVFASHARLGEADCGSGPVAINIGLPRGVYLVPVSVNQPTRQVFAIQHATRAPSSFAVLCSAVASTEREKHKRPDCTFVGPGPHDVCSDV